MAGTSFFEKDCQIKDMAMKSVHQMKIKEIEK